MNANVEHLQKAISAEVSAILNYMHQSVQLKALGYKKLSHLLHKDSIDEMHHMHSFMERLFELGGNPTYAGLKLPQKTKDMVKMLQKNAADETDAIANYAKAEHECEGMGDKETAKLFKKIRKDEEDHNTNTVNRLLTIKMLGKDEYK